MARGDDLSKTLDRKELDRLRVMLRQHPDIGVQVDDGLGGQFPRMLYHTAYVQAQKDWQEKRDPKDKQLADERMKLATHLVHDADEEAEFLEDGWQRSPADFYPAGQDPRVPVGRDARKQSARNSVSLQDELAQMMRRVAELQAQLSAQPAGVEADTESVGPRGKSQTPAQRKAAAKAATAAARGTESNESAGLEA